MLKVMPPAYDELYAQLLADAASAARVPEAEVTPFWPIAGWKFDGSLLAVGRSVNGWVHNWRIGELREASTRHVLMDQARRDAEPTDRCRMLWVTDLAGRTSHPYNTNRSAFWRVLRETVSSVIEVDATDWPSHLAWTNLYKLAPAAGWNPGADLQLAQRGAAIRLLEAEIAALRPRRILFLTGRWWAEPLATSLGMDIEWTTGLVEGAGRYRAAQVVVAKHPMGKPHRELVAQVLGAFDRSVGVGA
ncbi:hypothetical protein BH23CHL7_BH23CHL7_15970 [soil metagenome]